MIELPIGKALIAVEGKSGACEDCDESKIGMCENCDVKTMCVQCVILETGGDCRDVACLAKDRKDGKKVIFKLVDYKENP
ncbi:MAG: hypothetical protein LBC76_08130 [Treponema sp.]|jgi:hypothetical protein|nr:hypothetical protein [Treponema sp.]